MVFRAPLACLCVPLTTISVAFPSHAGEIDVLVNAQSARGTVGCALFSGSAGFPMDRSGALEMTAERIGGSLRCRFDVPNQPGTYAVSAFLDENGNGRLDRNALGLPTEPWAVSNNPRPALRAPRFSEAQFSLSAGEKKTIELNVK